MLVENSNMPGTWALSVKNNDGKVISRALNISAKSPESEASITCDLSSGFPFSDIDSLLADVRRFNQLPVVELPLKASGG